MSSACARHSRQSTAVILVAGIRGNDVWRGIESDSRLNQLNLRFYRFSYGRISTFSSGLSLDRAAVGLREFIVAHQEHDLVLVGHSVGGVIVQKLLTGPDNDLLDRVRLVLLIATPVSKGNGWFNRRFYLSSRHLIPEPEYLDILNREWNALSKQRGVPVVSVVGLRDNVAPYDAGRHWDARNLIVVDQDHIGLGHDTDLVSTILYDRLTKPSDATDS